MLKVHSEIKTAHVFKVLSHHCAQETTYFKVKISIKMLLQNFKNRNCKIPFLAVHCPIRSFYFCHNLQATFSKNFSLFDSAKIHCINLPFLYIFAKSCGQLHCSCPQLSALQITISILYFKVDVAKILSDWRSHL